MIEDKLLKIIFILQISRGRISILDQKIEHDFFDIYRDQDGQANIKSGWTCKLDSVINKKLQQSMYVVLPQNQVSLIRNQNERRLGTAVQKCVP